MVAESGRDLKIVIVKENIRDLKIVSDSKGLESKGRGRKKEKRE